MLETITSNPLMQHYDNFHSAQMGPFDERVSPSGRSERPRAVSLDFQPQDSSKGHRHRRTQSVNDQLIGLPLLDTMDMHLPPSNPGKRRHRRAQSIDHRLTGLQSLDSMDMDLPPSQPSMREHRRIHSGGDYKLLNPIGIPEPYMSKEDTTLQQSEGPRFMDATTPMMMEDITASTKVTAALEVSRDRILMEDSVSSLVSAVDIDWKTHFKGMLYDRSEEREHLFQAYQRIQSMEEDELDCILISGPCGTGKTYLAKSLQSPVEMDGGYFLMGKFDQLQRPEPYRAFKAAFTYFTNMVLQKDAQVVATMRDAILQAVGHEMGVLTAVIPAIRKIVGSTGESTPHVAGDALCRFAYVMRMFIRAICSREHPVVLFFDDLHWADICSLDLLRMLISDTECEGLVFVGTCLDSVSHTSSLSTALCKLEDENRARITNLSVGNFKPEMLRYMISETFHLSEEDSGLLSFIICHQTDGNMLYVMEFITWLENEGLLKYTQGTWKWDEQEIRLTIECNKIGDFLLDKLERLPQDVQEVLQVASCLGSNIDKPLLNLLMEKEVGDLLSRAADKELIVIQQEEHHFPTDGVQRAAYSMIPVDEREAFHLSLGRKLLKVLDKHQLEENLFTVLSQMKIGGRLITGNTEKRAIAMVCLHAGKVAAKSSAFRAAAEYLAFGISLLSERRWLGDETDLTLALYNAAAEVELCRSNFSRLDELIEDILNNTRRTDDQLQAQCTKIYALGVRDRQQEAIDLGIEILKSVGETFPSRLCMFHLMGEMKGVERLLRGKEDEQLLRQPCMTDFKKKMAMRILNIITLDCLLSRAKFAPYVTLKMVSLTMRHGLSEHASAAFAMFGILHISLKDQVDAGYRFGQLGLKLLKMYKMEEYLPRVYCAVYGCLEPWRKPLKLSLEPLMRAHRIGLLTGDLEFSALNANIYCFNKLWAGASLPETEMDLINFSKWMEAQKQEAALMIAKPCLFFIHVLMGKIKDPMDSTCFDIALENAKTKKNQMLNISVSKEKMIIGYLFGHYKEAAASFVKFEKGAPPSYSLIQALMCKGLVCLTLARQGIQKRKHMQTAKRVIKYMEKAAKKCPHNYCDKLFLLEAEYASVRGKADDAYHKFTCAIGMAAASGFTFIHAVALERVGWHVFRQHNADIVLAESYFDQACTRYEEWGAYAKVEHLRNEVSSLFAPLKLGLTTGEELLAEGTTLASASTAVSFSQPIWPIM